jgi:hypothetical protein
MGAFNKAKEIFIPRNPEEGQAWGWDSHESVTLKDVFTIGDAQAIKVMIDGVANASETKLLDRMILRWNLTDENGNVGVKNEQSIERLPANYSKPITEEIAKIMMKGQVVDANAFTNGASQPTSTN